MIVKVIDLYFLCGRVYNVVQGGLLSRGESAGPPMWLGLDFIWGLCLLMVLVLLRGYFSRFSVFSPPTKTNISEFQFDKLKLKYEVWDFSVKDLTFEFNKLFIKWVFALSLQAYNRPLGITWLANQSARYVGYKHKSIKLIKGESF